MRRLATGALIDKQARDTAVTLRQALNDRRCHPITKHQFQIDLMIAAMQHHHSMPRQASPTPVRLFTAMARAVRDQPMSGGTRERAFDLLAALAEQIHQPAFTRHVEAFLSFVNHDAQLLAAVGPFADDLCALSRSGSTGAWATELHRFAAPAPHSAKRP